MTGKECPEQQGRRKVGYCKELRKWMEGRKEKMETPRRQKRGRRVQVYDGRRQGTPATPERRRKKVGIRVKRNAKVEEPTQPKRQAIRT